MTVQWTTDVGQGDWWVDQLHPFAVDVGSLVPDSFEAVARLFHPVTHDHGRRSTWTESAEANGRIAHAEMQFHAISTPAGDRVPVSWQELGQLLPGLDTPWDGELPLDHFVRLADLLSAHTATPEELLFAFWDGYGGFTGQNYKMVGSQMVPTGTSVPTEFVDGPRIRAPNRDYLLATGSARDVPELIDTDGGNVPNMWWPADRSWFVATEIDFAWTYVGGSTQAIEAIESDGLFEAFRSGFDHKFTFSDDQVNR